MSSNSRTNIDEGNNSVAANYHRETQSEPTGHYISSVVINIRQLHTDLHAQHQYDKKALTELNRSFQLFVDRVQLLQSQNSKYRAAIADSRRQLSGISAIDVQLNEDYFALKRELSAMDNAKVDNEWDFELYKLQIIIYKELIEIEQQWKGKRSLILEEEVKQSVSVLISLRKSHAELQRKVKSLYGEYDDLSKQYLTLTYDWHIVKKQRSKWHLSVKTLKSYIGFYKHLRSYTGRDDFKSLSIQSDNVTEIRPLGLDKIIKKIRHDFEAFYATIYREMTSSYETKMAEIETDVKQALHYQSIEMEESAMLLQTQQMDYEKARKDLSYEKEILIKLGNTYSKLEAELKLIQFQHDERFEVQSKDLHNVQENIMFMAVDVDEIRRSKADLEAEIIVYRHLLDVYGIEQRVTIIPQIQTVGSETMGKFVVKSQKKGWIGIKACAPNGMYISLANYSTNKDIDISGWKLQRHIDSVTKLRYTIPDGVRLNRSSILRIYTKSGSGTTAESSSYQKLVNNDLVSWGMGNTIQTLLFNKNGDEEASYLQSVEFEGDNV